MMAEMCAPHFIMSIGSDHQSKDLGPMECTDHDNAAAMLNSLPEALWYAGPTGVGHVLSAFLVSSH